jgi:anaerobic magnesium-protoporphyrin IX monomethyl ester cyclase
MKVLLTHAYFLCDDQKEQRIMKPYPPLGLLYISAWLDKHEIANEVFDTTFASSDELFSYLIATQPAIIGIYVNLMTKPNALRLINEARKLIPGVKIILGGPEVTHSAEKFLRAGSDAIVIGEGEQTFLELVQCTLYGKSFNSSIAGIAFLDGDRFVQTTEREKLRDLDELPMPAREKINLHKYLEAWKKAHGRNAMSVSTMRGCPYTCKWCSRAVYGLSYRRRSPGKVVEELENIVKQYHPDTFWFVDDVFTISHKWLSCFKEELESAKLKIAYECITRADRLNEEVIHMLKDTGCFRVWIGAESGSQKVIDLMDRRVDVSQVREMIRLTRKHQMEAGTFIMLGYPGETEADIYETIQHLKESDPDHFTITLAYPIRGTELFDEVEMTNGDLSWSSSTDREIDFKRTYARKYYDFAVRRVVNEVNYFKSRNRHQIVDATRFKLKSLLAGLGMRLHR